MLFSTPLTVLLLAVTSLNDTVTEFFPSVPGTLTALKIAALSGDLKRTIDQGTNIVSQSEQLTQDESLPVAVAVISLANEVFSSLNNIVSKKWAFDQAIFGVISATPVVKLLLEALRSSTQEFGTTLTSRLDSSLQSVAPVILTNIDNAFADAIAAFS
ncbi:hypothetical protein DV735_g4210, partial [Chaetothyriales sp. CBS 134920]